MTNLLLKINNWSYTTNAQKLISDVVCSSLGVQVEMFKLNAKLQEISCGPVNLRAAIAELSKISSAAGRTYKDEIEALPATQFILTKNNEDYLRVECHSTQEVHFSSDRLVYSGSWLKKIFAKNLMQFRTSIEDAENVMIRYFSETRERFEEMYADSYTNGRSLKYVKLSR